MVKSEKVKVGNQIYNITKINELFSRMQEQITRLTYSCTYNKIDTQVILIIVIKKKASGAPWSTDARMFHGAEVK